MRDLDCRWITCDTYCHYTECILKKAYVDALSDKFEKIGFKQPEVAFQLSIGCDRKISWSGAPSNNDCKFENVRDPKTRLKVHDADIDDKEAAQLATARIEAMTDGELQDLYCKCLLKSMSIRIQELEKDAQDLKMRINELICLKNIV